MPDVSQNDRRRRLAVRLNRRSPAPLLHPFQDYFQGFEKVGAVRSVFGDRTEEVLGRLRIGFIPNRGMYMGIRDDDGNIAVGSYHLKTGPTRTLYLDVVHELFHINQWLSDKKYFHAEHMKFMKDRGLYYASPIEVPAYEHTVREAERIGMAPEEILEYLKMGEAPPKVWRSFLKEMKLGRSPPARRVKKLPVKIRRDTSPSLHPFTVYFLGFERAPAVRELLGDSCEDLIGKLRVEFIDSPFPSIFPSEEDGHLLVANDYFRTGRVASIYLDVFFSLSLLKGISGSGKSLGGERGLWGSPFMLRAYSDMVKEARRMGQTEKEILQHLRLPAFWMTPPEYKKFLKEIGVRRS